MLHILPRTIPICVSLHNAEFQGLWPLRNQKEMDEICKVFNLPEEVVRKYVQFGEVFNLLHAAASYLRVHQKGFGAVGVSKKYVIFRAIIAIFEWFRSISRVLLTSLTLQRVYPDFGTRETRLP